MKTSTLLDRLPKYLQNQIYLIERSTSGKYGIWIFSQCSQSAERIIRYVECIFAGAGETHGGVAVKSTEGVEGEIGTPMDSRS